MLHEFDKFGLQKLMHENWLNKTKIHLSNVYLKGLIVCFISCTWPYINGF